MCLKCTIKLWIISSFSPNWSFTYLYIFFVKFLTKTNGKNFLQYLTVVPSVATVSLTLTHQHWTGLHLLSSILHCLQLWALVTHLCYFKSAISDNKSFKENIYYLNVFAYYLLGLESFSTTYHFLRLDWKPN